MKLHSKYFDSIRIRGRAEEPRRANEAMCQWHGCQNAGRHRAPRGRGRDGEYFIFCLNHVRQYNATYNYFDGMSDAQVSAFQKEALTGHRPTWTMGQAGTDPRNSRSQARHYRAFRAEEMNDPHDFFTDDSRAKQNKTSERRAVRNVERRSLEALNLPPTASKDDIKARFKELVKRHHPDVNGGDTRSEDKLREIIQAYNYLKQAGLV
jgi:curved DNA-binding protein CbpA